MPCHGEGLQRDCVGLMGGGKWLIFVHVGLGGGFLFVGGACTRRGSMATQLVCACCACALYTCVCCVCVRLFVVSGC